MTKLLSSLLLFVLLSSCDCKSLENPKKYVNSDKSVTITAPNDLDSISSFSFITRDAGYGKFPIYQLAVELKYLSGSRQKRKIYDVRNNTISAKLIKNKSVLAKADK